MTSPAPTLLDCLLTCRETAEEYHQRGWPDQATGAESCVAALKELLPGLRHPKRLRPVTEDTPSGTTVALVNDQGEVTITSTRSVPWVLGGKLVVLVYGRSGGYLAERCYVVA